MAFRIVVANEPRLYREALAGALKLQRPAYDVKDVEPNQLESALVGTKPDLVIGTKLVPALRTQDGAPLLLYTPAGRLVVLGPARQIMQVTEHADLTDVLSLVDAFAGHLVSATPQD